MDRNEALNLLANTPEYVEGACSKCGAKTHEEANVLCRPVQCPSGEWECPTPTGGPNLDNDAGPLFQRNSVYDHIDGYLWGWYAVDEGYTKTPPEWTEPPQTQGGAG